MCLIKTYFTQQPQIKAETCTRHQSKVIFLIAQGLAVIVDDDDDDDDDDSDDDDEKFCFRGKIPATWKTEDDRQVTCSWEEIPRSLFESS